jgi:hypothetical protein
MTTDYGTYRLTFEPPSDMITPSVDMTLSGEADLSQMLSLFEAFLQASGYVLKGELEIVEPDTTSNLWGATCRGAQATDFIPFSQADDVLNFGAK